jgi:signal transduction histidine kinase
VSAADADAEPDGTVPTWSGVGAGLRTRITLAVVGVTLVLSVVLGLLTITITQQTLVNQREDSISRRAVANAQVVDGALGDSADVQGVLTSLADAGKASVVLTDPEGRPVSVSVDPRFGVDVLPRQLKDQVVEVGNPAIMRFELEDQTLVAVGVPLSGQRSGYFEVYRLDDIASGLRSLLITLAVATFATTFAAGVLGYWASGYTLRPLGRVSDAAEAVALGQLDTRIDEREYARDRDLAPLVSNFNAMVDALEDRIDRDARFASDVSHELRSPLTTLNAGLHVLQNNRDEMPERAQHALDLLAADVDRFTQLVEDLLEISRFDAGAVRYEPEEVALVPLVQATVANLGYPDVPVDTDTDLDDVVITCDKRRLVRIVANYLHNADRYADGATGVWIERHDPDPFNPFDELTIRIGVEDSGPGVPEAERERIFDRFNRGDQGGSRGADVGVGLGLALAAEHAALQGGRVWVEDRTDGGEGACFVVELPLVEPTERDDEDDLSAATPEAASALTLTGEHQALDLSASAGDGGGDPSDLEPTS